jgi:hypothetical protein
MEIVSDFVLELIDTGRQATAEEVAAIISQVAQAPSILLHHRALSSQVWGMRQKVGELYLTQQLTSEQVDRLARLDRALPDLAQVLIKVA